MPLTVDRSRSRRAHSILVLVAALMFATACGGPEAAAPTRNQMRVQALSVQGEMMVVNDLAETDTMLWFWAPW